MSRDRGDRTEERFELGDALQVAGDLPGGRVVLGSGGAGGCAVSGRERPGRRYPGAAAPDAAVPGTVAPDAAAGSGMVAG